MNTLPYLLKLLEVLQLPDDWHALRAPPVGLFRAFRSYFRSHPMWWLWITNHSLTFASFVIMSFPLLWGGAATCDPRECVEHCAGSGARRLSDCEARGFRVAWRWAWRGGRVSLRCFPPCIRLVLWRLETPHERSPLPSDLRFFLCPPSLSGAWPNTRPLRGKYVTPSHGGSRHPAPIIGWPSIL